MTLTNPRPGRRQFLVAGATVAGGVSLPIAALTGHAAAPVAPDDPHEEAPEHDVAVAVIDRPDRGFVLQIISCTSDCIEAPVAHALQDEIDASGLEVMSSVTSMSVASLELRLWVYEDAPQSMTLEIVDPALGGQANPEQHFISVAEPARRFLRHQRQMGLSYYLGVARALIGPSLTNFPAMADISDLRTVLLAPRAASADAHGSPGLVLSSVPLDPRCPGRATWQAQAEVLEQLRCERCGPPEAYWFVLHAQNPRPSALARELNALRQVDNREGLLVIAGFDNLGGTNCPDFVSVLGAAGRRS